MTRTSLTTGHSTAADPPARDVAAAGPRVVRA